MSAEALGSAPPLAAPSAAVPPSPRARSAFWPAFWMAVVMFVAKASHWSLPEPTQKRLGEYARDLLVSAHADLLFCVAIGLLGQLLLWLVRRRPTASFVAYGLYCLFCFACVIYAVASVQIFAYLRSPLTYALLYLADDMDTMSSSIGQFLSGPPGRRLPAGPRVLRPRRAPLRPPLSPPPLALRARPPEPGSGRLALCAPDRRTRSSRAAGATATTAASPRTRTGRWCPPTPWSC